MSLIIKPIPQGTTRSILFEFKNANGEAKDLTNYKVYFIVKKLTDELPDDSAAIMKKVASTPEPLSGKAYITITGENSSIPIGQYNYSFILVENETNNMTVPEGFPEILEITRNLLKEVNTNG